MSTQHTSEPWEVNHRLSGFPQIATGDGVVIVKTDCSISSVYWVNDSKRAQANARRIVACVNACKGINPESVPDLLEALQRALVALNVAFTAEEDPFGVHHNDAVDAVSMAEVAIAKVTNTTKH